MESKTRKTRKYIMPTCVVVGAMVAGSLLGGCKTRQEVIRVMYGPPPGTSPLGTLIDTQQSDNQQQTNQETTVPQKENPPEEPVYGPPLAEPFLK